jgi:hypothetical protein
MERGIEGYLKNWYQDVQIIRGEVVLGGNHRFPFFEVGRNNRGYKSALAV